MPGTLPVLREVEHGEWAWAVAFSADGELLATVAQEGMVRVKDMP